MKVYTILRNLVQGIKNAISHCDANLQIAKDYTDEGLTIKPYDLTITNSDYGSSAYLQVRFFK